jgi:ABC-2 type transport system permease protein
MPRWRPAAAIVLRYFYLLRGSPARVVPLFAWVGIDIVLWGFISRFLNSVSGAGMNFVPLLLGAVLLWDFLIRVMQGVTMAFFEDVWSRNFLNVFATPLSIAEYLTGLVLSSIVTSAVGLAVMLAMAAAFFGLSFFSYGFALAAYLFTLFLFGIALGVFASGLVLRLGPAAEWFIWPIPALLSPFAGVFYPVSTLPMWMQAVSRALPPSYVFEAGRSVASGHGAAPEMLARAAVLSAIYLALACWWFAGIYRHAVRTGLIARFSAESLS